MFSLRLDTLINFEIVFPIVVTVKIPITFDLR